VASLLDSLLFLDTYMKGGVDGIRKNFASHPSPQCLQSSPGERYPLIAKATRPGSQTTCRTRHQMMHPTRVIRPTRMLVHLPMSKVTPIDMDQVFANNFLTAPFIEHVGVLDINASTATFANDQCNIPACKRHPTFSAA
jgi:hypothetical protein